LFAARGRPGFDTDAVAVVMVVEDKKNFYKKFLYMPFPVESCLDQRLNENLNAEIASGTIRSLEEAVGYLSWTFYARRVKRNPAYYGANSGDAEHVEDHLFNVAKRSLGDLKNVGCVETEGEGDDLTVSPTVLCLAGSQYYLAHHTPKHFQVGLREARRLINQFGANRKVAASNDAPRKPGTLFHSATYSPSEQLDEISIAWILLTVSSSPEFDELPVRHNEELLNEELSDELMWGPDMADLLAKSDGKKPYRGIDTFKDPHTKCFLLIQAYLQHAPLPISDYINDTRSVIENLPRLLAAAAFVAAGDKNDAGSFDCYSQCVRTRQLLAARAKATDDPICQIPGIGADSSVLIGVRHLSELRALDRNQAATALQKAIKKNQQRTRSLDLALEYVYSLPMITVTQTEVSHGIGKTDCKLTGKLQVTVEVERIKGKTNNRINNKSTDSMSLTLLVGSASQNFLLAQDNVRMGRFGKWTAERSLLFDWDSAKADGNHLMLRLLVDEVRGLDMEYMIQLL
jgi:activating signal cointegrator complex subunit 3